MAAEKAPLPICKLERSGWFRDSGNIAGKVDSTAERFDQPEEGFISCFSFQFTQKYHKFLRENAHQLSFPLLFNPPN